MTPHNVVVVTEQGGTPVHRAWSPVACWPQAKVFWPAAVGGRRHAVVGVLHTEARELGLGIAGALALGAFVLAERRAAEPVLPLALLRNSVFSVTSTIGLVVRLALFGSITYLPLFLLSC